MLSKSVKKWGGLAAAAFLLGECSRNHSPYRPLSEEHFPPRTKPALAKNHPTVAAQEAAHIRKALQNPRGHLYAGLPKSVRQLTIVTNISSIVGYDEENGGVAWAAFRVWRTGEIGENQISGKRTGGFRADKRTKLKIPGTMLNNSGWDNGHVTPYDALVVLYGGELREQVKDELRLMSIIVPQPPDFNRVTMRHVEKLEANYWANALKEVFVIAGTEYAAKSEKITHGEHEISKPAGYFRIEVDEEDNRIRMMVFEFPVTTGATTNIAPFLSTLGRVQSRNKANYFPDLPEEARVALEDSKQTELWKLKWEK